MHTSATKPVKKSDTPRKPSKPSQIDCDNDHKITAQDDKTLSGVLVVKKCHASRFARKPSRSNNVGNKLSTLLFHRLNSYGVKDLFNVKIVKTVGDKKETQFHYSIPCDKSYHKSVIASMKDACKDKDLADTCTHENQPDNDDSSSSSEESNEKPGNKPAPGKVTQKDVPHSKATDAPKPKTGKFIKVLVLFSITIKKQS